MKADIIVLPSTSIVLKIKFFPVCAFSRSERNARQTMVPRVLQHPRNAGPLGWEIQGSEVVLVAYDRG
jgi:hypothetical protein